MGCYENRSTIMTSNRPIEEWGKLLSDVPAAGAILDRLLHHARLSRSTGAATDSSQPPSSHQAKVTGQLLENFQNRI
jgi:DNA replication protein DnaC